MTKPRLFFEGFNGARKVQSMMIDFPELRFSVFYERTEELAEIRGIDLSPIELSDDPVEYVALIWFKTENGYGKIESHANNNIEIYVAPESEAFFENVNADYDGSTDKTIYKPQVEA